MKEVNLTLSLELVANLERYLIERPAKEVLGLLVELQKQVGPQVEAIKAEQANAQAQEEQKA